MVAFSAIDPVSMDVKASTTVSGVGFLLTNDSTNNTVDLTADGEVCIGVSAGESSRDADGTLETTGATVSMFPLGGVMMVASKASQTYTTGLLVYVGASGLAIDSNDASSKVLGVYVGSGETTSSSDGDLIRVNTASHANA